MQLHGIQTLAKYYSINHIQPTSDDAGTTITIIPQDVSHSETPVPNPEPSKDTPEKITRTKTAPRSPNSQKSGRTSETMVSGPKVYLTHNKTMCQDHQERATTEIREILEEINITYDQILILTLTTQTHTDTKIQLRKLQFFTPSMDATSHS